MIAETNIWVLVDNNIPLFLSKGQELSTNKPYEVYNSVDSFLEKLDELSIDWEQPLIPEDPPNWDQFNAQMLSDPEFNQVYNTANAIAPVVCASLPAALTQVSNGQLSMFNVVWNQIMSLGGATQAQRDKWSQWAEDNNLPTDFVNILKGV